MAKSGDVPEGGAGGQASVLVGARGGTGHHDTAKAGEGGHQRSLSYVEIKKQKRKAAAYWILILLVSQCLLHALTVPVAETITRTQVSQRRRTRAGELPVRASQDDPDP